MPLPQVAAEQVGDHHLLAGDVEVKDFAFPHLIGIGDVVPAQLRFAHSS